MTACVYITDPSWFLSLERSGWPEPVNFWRRDSRRLNLRRGDAFYFKLKGSMSIAGRASFREQVQLTLEDAWARFGLGNGASSFGEFEALIASSLKLTGDSINCVVLENVTALPDAERPAIERLDFPLGIQ